MSARMTAWDRRRQLLPYGMWTCADGREVLFNREYTPIWQRVDGCVSPAGVDEWVPWVSQSWFYNDGHTLKHSALVRRLEAILAAFQQGEDVSHEFINTPTHQTRTRRSA